MSTKLTWPSERGAALEEILSITLKAEERHNNPKKIMAAIYVCVRGAARGGQRSVQFNFSNHSWDEDIRNQTGPTFTHCIQTLRDEGFAVSQEEPSNARVFTVSWPITPNPTQE